MPQRVDKLKRKLAMLATSVPDRPRLCKNRFLCGVARSDGIAIEHDDVWEWGYRSWGLVRRLALLMIFVG